MIYLIESINNYLDEMTKKIIIPSEAAYYTELISDDTLEQNEKNHLKFFDNLPSFAIQLHYDFDFLLSTMKSLGLEEKLILSKLIPLLLKITNNIINHPSESKFRHITLDLMKHKFLSEIIQDTTNILSTLGFEKYIDTPNTLSYDNLDYPFDTQINENNDKLKFYNILPNDKQLIEHLSCSKRFFEVIISSWEINTNSSTTISHSNSINNSNFLNLSNDLNILKDPSNSTLKLPNNFSEKEFDSTCIFKQSQNIISDKNKSNSLIDKFSFQNSRNKKNNSLSLNSQLNEARERFRERFNETTKNNLNKPTQFLLKGMNEDATKTFLENNENKSNKNSHLEKANSKVMTISSLNKPSKTWEPEKCLFYYSSQFKSLPQYSNLNSLSKLIELNHNYEYIGRLALDFTNHYRSLHKLPRLAWNNDLMLIGQKHSKNMAEQIVPFGHAGSKERFKKYPFHSHFSGENVAAVLSSHQIALDSVDGWIHSPGHEKNLRDKYSQCGIGVWSNNSYFYLTQMFGLK